MVNKSQSYSSGRNFGHSVITWEIENYGLALWQKYWEVETPPFSVHGPESQKTKWKLILQTDSDGANVNERMSVKFDGENRRAIILDSKEKTLTNSELTVSTNVDSTQTASAETDNQRSSEITDSEQKKSMKVKVKPKYLCDSLMLNLERSKVDKGPNTVWVNWRVYYVGVDGNKFSVSEEERFFVKGYKYGIHIGIMFDLEREFECNSGAVTFVCDMIVREEYSDVYFDKDINIDLYGLSEDFQWVFEQQKYSDIEIKCDKKSVFAHKAMLSLRSEYLKNVIKEKDLDVVELPNVSYDGMVKTLEYMYSGDLDDIVGKPSISTYDSIACLNLPDLEAHYAPDVQKIRTKIVVKRLTYMWSIKDFMAKETSCLSSPIICKDIEDAAWQIHLYPRGADGKSEFVSVCVEHLEGTVSDDLSIQCAVMEENETCHSWRTLQKSEKFNSKFEDEKFIDRKNLLKVLRDDLLKLGFKVRMYTGKEHAPIHSKAGSPVLCTKKKSFETLSNCMSILRQSKEYSDVILKVGDEEIKAHKFILSARSFMLSSMLEETEGNCLILTVKPNILKILLDYMYCAILDVSDINTLLEVYDAAEEFLISRLREKCSQVLLSSLSLDTVCDVLDLADNYENKSLKKGVIRFMNLNGSVFEQQAWQNLKAKKPQLCEEADTIMRMFNDNADVLSLSDEFEKVVRFKEMEDEIIDGIARGSSQLPDRADTDIISLIKVKEENFETTENNGAEVSKHLHEAVAEIILSDQEPTSDKMKMIAQMMNLNESDNTQSSRRGGRNEEFPNEPCVKVEVVSEKMRDAAKIQSKSCEEGSELSNQPTVEMAKTLPKPSGGLEMDLMTHSNGATAQEQQADNGFEAAVPISKERICQRVLEVKNLEEDEGNGLEIVALVPEKKLKVETAPVTCKVSEASETPGESRGKVLGAKVLKEPCTVESTLEASEGDSCAKGSETTSKTA